MQNRIYDYYCYVSNDDVRTIMVSIAEFLRLLHSHTPRALVVDSLLNNIGFKHTSRQCYINF